MVDPVCCSKIEQLGRVRSDTQNEDDVHFIPRFALSVYVILIPVTSPQKPQSIQVNHSISEAESIPDVVFHCAYTTHTIHPTQRPYI
jgi:hypothetical protein